MSAFGGKADVNQGVGECPLLAISGHYDGICRVEFSIAKSAWHGAESDRPRRFTTAIVVRMPFVLPSSATGGHHLGKPGSKLEAFQSKFHKPVGVNPGHPIRRPDRSFRGLHPATPKDNHGDGDHDHRDNDPGPGPPATPNRTAAPGASFPGTDNQTPHLALGQIRAQDPRGGFVGDGAGA